jgi:hypothetical protein
MSKIKLRKLLNLTEQAPQPPAGNPAAPVPAPAAPVGMNAGASEEPTAEPPVSPDTAPEPEDPSEYDFTRDFRAFEDKKNKAEADAKKILLDKMNKRLLNKTIIANASRGYGQPKTDYTIENVKKISVEFWYKDYVVIATDQNDKKYFLTPGINIKIDSEGSQPAPDNKEGPPAANGQGQEGPPQGQQPPAGGQEAPNEQPAANGNPPEQEGPPQNTPPQEEPAAPQPQSPAPTEPEPEDPQLLQKKKKKLPPVAEWVQKDLSSFLVEFMVSGVKDKNGRIDFIRYIKKVSNILSENKNVTKIKCHLLIPENHMITHVDNRDVKLAAIDTMRKQSRHGQYSNGSVDVVKNGRYYLLEYTKEIGRDV